MPLSECDKCQCGEGGSASLILTSTAVEGEPGLTKRYAPLKVSLQSHGQPEIGLRLRDAQFVIKCLQQRNLLFEQGACAVVCALVACKFGGTKKGTRPKRRRKAVVIALCHEQRLEPVTPFTEVIMRNPKTAQRVCKSYSRIEISCGVRAAESRTQICRLHL